MPNEEEQRERYREVGEELGVRGGHAVAFAVHLYIRPQRQYPILTLNWCSFKSISKKVPQQCAHKHSACVGRTYVSASPP